MSIDDSVFPTIQFLEGCCKLRNKVDNCLQPASENYQQFLFSLKATFGGFVWKFRLEILFGNFRLEISFGNFVWKFVWKFRLENLFGRQTDRQTNQQTEGVLEAPSRSLKTAFLQPWSENCTRFD